MKVREAWVISDLYNQPTSTILALQNSLFMGSLVSPVKALNKIA